MINDFIRKLVDGVNQKLQGRHETDIRKKVEAMSLIQQKFFHWERFLFLVCQPIAHYIDEHTSISNKPHSIPFVFAVFIYHNIVDFKYKIWSSVKFIKEMQTLYRQQKNDIILQVIKPNENMTVLQFERHFSCICSNQKPSEMVTCEKCLKNYHPSCQDQKLVCNKCYLTHFFFPLDWTFYNRFGEKYHTHTYFHSKFKAFNHTHETRKVQFFAMEFDINDFADLQNAQEPQLWIKIMNFSDLSHNSKNEKWKNYTNKTSEYSMIINSNKFEFYLNFQPLRRKFLYFRNENSLMFKLQNRMADEKNNVLMIVCHPDFDQQETYEIGVFRIKKTNQNKKEEIGRSMSEPFDLSEEDKLYRIKEDQYKILQKYSTDPKHLIEKSVKPISIKENESESEEEKGKKPQIEIIRPQFELVRSYGCTHKEGFSYKKIKDEYEQLREHCKLDKKPSDKEKSLNERLTDVKRQEKLGFEKKVKNFKTKVEEIRKQEKKYAKFVKCPICQNHVMSLYLLPYDLKEGQEMRNLHSGNKKKTGRIKGLQLEERFFERRSQQMPIQKKEEESGEESFSPCEQEHENQHEHDQENSQREYSQFCTIVQSGSDQRSSSFDEKSLSYQYDPYKEQEKHQNINEAEAIESLEEGEMALNEDDEEMILMEEEEDDEKEVVFHQSVADRIFNTRRHEVMSEESSYGAELEGGNVEVIEEEIDEEQFQEEDLKDTQSNKIVEESNSIHKSEKGNKERQWEKQKANEPEKSPKLFHWNVSDIQPVPPTQQKPQTEEQHKKKDKYVLDSKHIQKLINPNLQPKANIVKKQVIAQKKLMEGDIPVISLLSSDEQSGELKIYQ